MSRVERVALRSRVRVFDDDSRQLALLSRRIQKLKKARDAQSSKASKIDPRVIDELARLEKEREAFKLKIQKRRNQARIILRNNERIAKLVALRAQLVARVQRLDAELDRLRNEHEHDYENEPVGRSKFTSNF